MTSKFFFVSAFVCVSTATAFSQDCNSYLRRATELVSQQKYCDAIGYYQMYGRCNADADVSTEIAMCERRCKIEAMDDGEDTPAVTSKPANTPSTVRTTDSRNSQSSSTPASSRPVKPTTSVNKSPKLKLGSNLGLVYPTEQGYGDKIHLYFGGGISGEFIPTPHIGFGLSAGYYAYQLELSEFGVKTKTTASLIPIALTSKFYIMTKNVQPYIGVDAGLYIVGLKMKVEGVKASASESFFGLAPVTGIQIKLSNALALDVNAKCNLIFIEGEIGYNIGFNTGIVFKFGK